jgi:hypothetical protein
LPKKIFFIADTRCRARYVRIRSDKANKVKAEREVRQWIYDITRKAIPDSLNVTFFALVRRRSTFAYCALSTRKEFDGRSPVAAPVMAA